MIEPLRKIESSDPLLGGIGHVSFDEEMNVFVTDYQQRKVFMFDDAGSYVREYGRPGEGPGEFNVVVSVEVVGNEVYAYDNRSSRLSIFDKETAAFKRSLAVKTDEWSPFNLLGVEDGYAFFLCNPPVSFADPEFAGANYQVRRVSLDTGEAEPIWETPRIDFHAIEVMGQRMLRVMPLSPDSRCTIADGTGYCGYSDAININSFSTQGDSVGTVSVVTTPDRVTSTDRDEILAGFANEELRSQIVVPETRPAFGGRIVVDEKRRILIQRSASADDGTVYWVIDPAARTVDSIRMEGSVTLFDAADGKVAGVGTIGGVLQYQIAAGQVDLTCI